MSPQDPSVGRVQLTVRVLVRATAEPLAGALVQVSAHTGHTDASGLCRFSVPSGDLVNVDVSANGFGPFGASGVLASDERWTFYLAPVAATD